MNPHLRWMPLMVLGLLWPVCGSAEDRLRRHALVVVGIPGDQEHRDRFLDTTKTWRTWLITVAGVDEQDLMILSAANPKTPVSTAENLAQAVKQLRDRASEEDSVWVFLLGHGSQDARHAWLHLPGPDLDAIQWASLFADMKATEQVFWLTQAGSGGFLKAFSAPGRIVITATDTDGEVNATRFPHLLAELMQTQLASTPPDSRVGPVASPDQENTPTEDEPAENEPTDRELAEKEVAEASRPQMESITNVLQLFRATASRVNEEFTSTGLVPTEHAQLDDNGDQAGTDFDALEPETMKQAAVESDVVDTVRFPIDGVLAQRTVIFPERIAQSTESSADSLPSDRSNSQFPDPTP